MRILVCSNVYPPDVVGGAELVAHEQAAAYARQGHEVRAFAGDPGSVLPRHARTEDVHGGIPVTRIALTPEDYSPEFLNFLHPEVEAHFRDVLHDFAPDVVHGHNLPGLSVKLPMIVRAAGARMVCTLHDFWGFCPRNTAVRPDGAPCAGPGCCQPRLHDGRELDLPPRFRRDFMTLALAHVDRLVAPSRFVADRYVRAGFECERIVVVPNGVDTDRFRPTGHGEPRDGVRITFAGYFGAHKGVSTLLAALALLPAGVTLELAGEGPEEPAYRAQVEALGLGDRVRFAGKVPPAAMAEVYARSDIVVLPSVWDENQPVCLMEAMAAGLPVVASRRGGIPEIVEHRGNGLTFQAGDVGELAARLAELVADPARRAAMGRAGRERVERCTHDRQAERLLALFDDVSRLARAQPEPAVFAVMGGDWERLNGHDPLLIVPADAPRRPRLLVPLEWVEDCFARFDGLLFAGRIRLGRRTRFLKRTVALPSWLIRFAAAALRRIALPPR